MAAEQQRSWFVDWAEEALAGDGWSVEETPTGVIARRGETEVEVERTLIEEFERDPLAFLFLVRAHGSASRPASDS